MSFRGILRFGRHVAGAWSRFQKDDGFLMAAAVAYSSALAFFPLMLILTSGLGIFLRFTATGQEARAQILNALEGSFSPQMREQVRQLLETVGDKASVGGPIGFLLLLMTAVALFAQFERAFDRIWNLATEPKPGVLRAVRRLLVDRMRAFLLLLAVGTLVLLNFIVGMVLNGVQSYTTQILPGADWAWRLTQIVLSIGLNAAAFALLYRLLPKSDVRWSEAFQGGLFTSVVWEIGRQALAMFVIGGKYTSAYGVIGSFIAVMLWVYYANAVIFLGAEFVQEICRRCDPEKASAESV